MRTLIAGTFAVAVVALGGLSHAAIIIVPDDQPTIQAAIDVAMPGDSIQVRPNVYNEVLLVPETLTNLTIEGLGGRPTLAPLVSADAITVDEADGFTLRMFAVQGGKIGVRLDDVLGATVSDVIIADATRDGIRVKRGGATLDGNVITNATGGRCIRVEKAPGAQVTGNTVSGCDKEGIRVKVSDGATVSDNDSDGNGADGIQVQKCLTATVTLNGADGNAGRGIRVKASPGSTIDTNETDGNTRTGLLVERSETSAVTNNNADTNSEYGIHVKKSPPIATVADVMGAGNTATGNTLGDFRVDP